jgi:uncharacterized protein (TIGR00369 family)
MSDTERRLEQIIYAEHPDYPGWMAWTLRPQDEHRFNRQFQPLLVRKEASGDATARFFPNESHSNIANNLHGGALLSFLDIAMFAGARAMGVLVAAAAVTADIQVQFVSGGRIDRAIDARVELVRETRSLIFLRGIVVQADDTGGETTIASFTGLLKKLHQK